MRDQSPRGGQWLANNEDKLNSFVERKRKYNVVVVTEDWLTISGAARLAAQITAFWRQNGHKISVSIEQNKDAKFPIFSIRSNLVNGLPSKQGLAK